MTANAKESLTTAAVLEAIRGELIATSAVMPNEVTVSARACCCYPISTGMQITPPSAVPILAVPILAVPLYFKV